MAAIYTNNQTHEVYTLNGVTNLKQAYNLAEFVCHRNDWNYSMFTYDVTVKLIK